MPVNEAYVSLRCPFEARNNAARNVGGRIELCQKGLSLGKAHADAWALPKACLGS